MTHVASGVSPASAPNRLALRLIRVCSLAAAGVSGYLLYLSLANRGLPPGCGAGSGCEAVLASRWSQVFGIPVSGPAAGLYLALFVTTFFVPGPSGAGSGAKSLLTLLAATVTAAVVWFVALQFVVVGSLCVWCMTDHAFGLGAAVLIFRTVSGSDEGGRGTNWLRVGGTAFVLVAGLALMQGLGPYAGPAIQRLPPGVNADTGPGADRVIAVLDGKLRVAPRDVPMLGSPDSRHLIVLLFDYCCPHCRATHGYLQDSLPRYGDELGVILLPMPLNSECNPYWEHTESRFASSCELAKVALGVWKADPGAFAEFDAWLFEPEMPRDRTEARTKAEELVGGEALRAAMDDEWILERIRESARAYHESGAERLPVLMSPGLPSIVGRPESAEELFGLLENELGLSGETPQSTD